MAFSTTALNTMLDNELGTAYVQLHTGSPGAAGTTNVAGNSTRKLVSWGSASAGSKSQNADITWTSVSNSETYTHISLWSAATLGTFLGSSTLFSSSSVVAGNTFVLPTSSIVASAS